MSELGRQGAHTAKGRRHGDCAAAILAGGRSRRMGGGLKALEMLGGRPMLGHVIERLAPQVDTLWLSVETACNEFSVFGLEQVPDPEPGSHGPLGGLLAALGKACANGYDWLALAPCDAPFIPTNLVQRLRERADRSEARIATVARKGQLHPVFSLWQRDELASLHAAVEQRRMGGFRAYLDTRPHAVLEWNEGEDDPFFNVNDRTALGRAEARLAQSREAES